MGLDLVIRNARIAGCETEPIDIGILGGRFVAIQQSLPSSLCEIDAAGRLLAPGFVETHIHLDKSHLLGRCACQSDSLDEAIAAVARAKRDFTEEDVYERARLTVEKAIMHGTMRMRAHVEVDPRVGLISFRALRQLQIDYAWGVDLQLCVFPQEGLLDDPGCEDVLIAALEQGADVVGGAPYMDKDSRKHIARIFALAQRYDRDIDLHLEFSLEEPGLDLEEVCRLTAQTGWGRRVAIGHVTTLSTATRATLKILAAQLADCGIAITALPATDLFLMGRQFDHNVPRGLAPVHRLLAHGVTCSLSTNNVLNPFTPFGDCSLVRIANFYANVAQVGDAADMAACFDMITVRSAELLNLPDYGIAVGNPADFVVMDCETRAQAVSEIAPVRLGFKAGKRTFSRPSAELHRPG